MADNEFGFSLISESDIKAREEKTLRKLNQVRDVIMPFLHNLAKDPDKTYIFWEDRSTKVNEFIEKINKIINE